MITRQRQDALCYGADVTAAEVLVEPAFGDDSPFLIGRTAAASPTFPAKLPESDLGVMTGAACGLDAALVRRKAFAELVEHVSAFEAAADAVPHLVRASLAELRGAGDAAIPPSHLQHFAPWQQLPDAIERAPDESVHTWCRGVRLATGEPVYVPALAVYLGWDVPPGERLVFWPSATGLAARRAPQAAQRHALLEVIERDACALSWRVLGYPVAPLPLSMVPGSLRETCARLGLEIELYRVGEAGLPPTVIALLSADGDSELTVGSACGTLGEALVGKAVGEALMLQWTMRSCPAPALDPTIGPQTSHEHVAAAYQSGANVAGWYRGQAARGHPGRATPCFRDVHRLAQAVERVLGSPVVAAEATSAAARASGWHVWRVIVPGALPREGDHSLAHLGGPRLERQLAPHPVEPARLHMAPHPFG